MFSVFKGNLFDDYFTTLQLVFVPIKPRLPFLIRSVFFVSKCNLFDDYFITFSMLKSRQSVNATYLLEILIRILYAKDLFTPVIKT